MHHRRSGITLTEVLVAIFVCGLGMMALMTLFPLGAMNMAQAIKDDRCGHCAANAAAIFRAAWRVSLETGGKIVDNTGKPVDDPTLRALETALDQGPVFVDPVGFLQYGGQDLPNGIKRQSFGNVSSFAQAVRWCTLLDDLDCNPNATPVSLGGQEVSRQYRYSWAWMVRWLKPPEANRRARAVEFVVVVFHNRPMTQSVSGVPIGETPVGSCTIGADPRSVTMPGKPAVRKGSWIMDQAGYFYRVESVKDIGGSLAVGVQTPFRSGGGTMVVMENVAEAFERSTAE